MFLDLVEEARPCSSPDRLKRRVVLLFGAVEGCQTRVSKNHGRETFGIQFALET